MLTPWKESYDQPRSEQIRSVLSRVWLSATPWTAAYQAPPSVGFSRQEYWSGVPLPSPNMPSRLVITFLPRSKRLLISWLQSPSAVILEPRKIVVHRYNGILLLFICSVMSSSFQPHAQHHARLPCPSLSLGACSNSCQSSWWYHPTISSTVAPFSSYSQSFPASGALHIWWPKYWSFSFSISPSNEYSVLIPFRIDWFDLLAVQGTLKSLLQHHSSKALILQCSAFFMVHSHIRLLWWLRR